MSSTKPFRFAAQLGSSPDGTAKGWAEQARRVEDLGYATLLMPDHFETQLAPIPALAAVADATSTLRMGSLVFGNDYRHPLVLAKEMATLDVLSNGRFEASLGAGWMRTDYEQAGITYDAPGVRVDRFSEAIAVIKGLLSTDGPFSFSGDHYSVTEHTLAPRPVQQPRPPLIIGGGGKRVLYSCRTRGGHCQHQRRSPRWRRRSRSCTERRSRYDTTEDRMGQASRRGSIR